MNKPRQAPYLHLVAPFIWGAKNTLASGKRIERFKVYFFGTLTLLFWAGLLFAGKELLARLAAEEPFGPLLVHKLLGFLFMMFFAVLVFSNVITSLNNLFLADDLYLLITAPVRIDRLFLIRALQAGLQSGWMVLLFAAPLMFAAGIVFQSPWWYYPWSLLAFFIFLLPPSALGAIVTTVLVKAFPARKTQDVLIILTIVLVVVFYFLLRFLQPEQLFNPDLFQGFTEYFATLRAPNSPLIPSVWVTEALWAGLNGSLNGEALFISAFGLATGLASIAIAAWIADLWYFEAYSKAQEGRRARFSTKIAVGKFMERLVPTSNALRRQIIVKDLKSFFRETSQWTQLLLLLALIVVYLFNFKVLKLERFSGIDFYIRNVVAYVNLVLAGFVLSAVSVRFVLPAVSTEGRAFWLLQAAPVKMKDVILAKYALFTAPIVVIGQALVIISNQFLRTHYFLTLLSSGMMLLISFAICSLAIGVGAIMPSFNERNVGRMATGASAIVYMVAAMIYILFLVGLAYFPGRIAFMAILSHQPINLEQWGIIGTSMLTGMVTTGLIVIYPLVWGIRALERREN